MHVKVDLRQDVSIVLDRTRALVEALKAMPETVEGMEVAKQALGGDERAQLVEVLGLLAFHGYQLSQRAKWLQYELARG